MARFAAWPGGSTSRVSTPLIARATRARSPAAPLDFFTTSERRRARQAAGPRDIRIGGGVETIRQYLRAQLVDEMHLAIAPVLLGTGEHLLQGLALPRLGYRISEHVASGAATHVVLTR